VPAWHSTIGAEISTAPIAAGTENTAPVESGAGEQMVTPAVEISSERAATTRPDSDEPIVGMLQFHPLAEIFSMASDKEIAELARDIAENGLLDALMLYEGRVLDGRCRYRGCLIAGVEPRFEEYAGADPVMFVISRNLHRRHLTDRQRAFSAARFASLAVGANQHSRQVGSPIGDAAKLFKVSERSISRAKVVLATGTAELITAVETGGIAISAAEKISGLPAPEQHQALALAAAGRPRPRKPHVAGAPGDAAPKRAKSVVRPSTAVNEPEFFAPVTVATVLPSIVANEPDFFAAVTVAEILPRMVANKAEFLAAVAVTEILPPSVASQSEFFDRSTAATVESVMPSTAVNEPGFFAPVAVAEILPRTLANSANFFDRLPAAAMAAILPSTVAETIFPDLPPDLDRRYTAMFAALKTAWHEHSVQFWGIWATAPEVVRDQFYNKVMRHG